MIKNLLTVAQVAEFLQIAISTVYDNAARLGGFYPGGIRVLRFKPEVIYGSLEGQGQEGLALRLLVHGEEVRRRRSRKQTGSVGGEGGTKKRSAPGAGSGTDDHRLFRYR